jgi:hypothetical protein
MEEKELEEKLADAKEEGYKEAMKLIEGMIQLKEMGISDCEIVKRLDAAPAIVHGVLEHLR